MIHRFAAIDLAAVMGANIRRLREASGLRVEHLAARVPCAPERLAAAEAGALRLGAGEIQSLGLRLGCTLDAFFADPSRDGA